MSAIARDRVTKSKVAPVVLLVLALAAAVPLLFLGPGTDLDVGPVIESGRGILDGDYTASRPPGAPVHEAAVGLLEGLGGTALANLGSLAMAAVATVALVALLRREGVTGPWLAAAVLVANPWFLIAASSTVDFCWALAFALLAANLLRRDQPVAAGVLAALAIGSRAASVLLVLALVVAELTDGTDRRRPALTTAAIAAAGGALLYVPSFLAAGSSLAFAQNEFSTSSPLVQLGRFAVKNLYLVGPFAAVVLALTVPSVLQVLRGWRADWLVRFATVGLVLTQLLFLRFPWKFGHLLPSLACLALLLGRALAGRRALLAAVVVAQAAYAVVNLQLIRPDNPNEATGGELTFEPAWGALVIDTQCRADDPDAWEDDTRVRLDAVWNCAKPWS
jgi:hypothetical protein